MAASIAALMTMTSHLDGSGTPRTAFVTRQPASSTKVASTHTGIRITWGIMTSTRQPVIHSVRSGVSVQ